MIKSPHKNPEIGKNRADFVTYRFLVMRETTFLTGLGAANVSEKSYH